MPSFAFIDFAGHLGKAPEQRDTSAGKVVSFPVAVGKRDEKPIWFRVSVWGKQGQNCMKYLEKGRAVYVRGRLSQREYEKDGGLRQSLEVSADAVQFLNAGDSKGGNARPPEREPGDDSWGEESTDF